MPDSLAVVVNGSKLFKGDGATPTETFTEIAEVVTVTVPTQEPVEVDVSHLQSASREKRAGLSDTGAGSFQINFIPTDAGHLALQTAGYATVKTPANWRVLYPAPYATKGVSFRAAVGSFQIEEMALDTPLRATVSLVSGPPAAYTTP